MECAALARGALRPTPLPCAVETAALRWASPIRGLINLAPLSLRGVSSELFACKDTQRPSVLQLSYS